ncbi:hypothetical protein NB636_10390 [Oxalobacter aliiformigenes]|uniref:hypothetical protein n=1 Tax=Oxalobacter aliiformigenes TaxID=2946593 RepID=UPI0022AFDF2C|nr:hypothetical protein [Oxalobacter aliiformigenes]MCZ4065388.1 hypothetical protein [Oxalobacter aliiformigenes]WAV99073.1 hypothetical protein NB636_10390 [Oxalobacter aliiformigenes]
MRKTAFKPFSWYREEEEDPFRQFAEQAHDTCCLIALVLDMTHQAMTEQDCHDRNPLISKDDAETCFIGCKQIARLLAGKAFELIDGQNRHNKRQGGLQ